MKKNAQIGIEYMIIVGFVTMAIMLILAFSFVYSNQIKDRIKLNQAENFAIQLINSAESVFFAGEPSKTTASLYLPDGVEEIYFSSNAFIISTRVSSGVNRRSYSSKVSIQNTTTINTNEGIKKLVLEARANHVDVSSA